jgi:signal transduction histidine kinase
MLDEPSSPGNLRPEELEAVYAISRAVTNSVNMDYALDEIAYLARPVFIFDNMVVYRRHGENLEPAYARAIGRGRSQEAELVWGEATAHQVIASSKVASLREGVGSVEERTDLRYSLGLPLRLEKDVQGALVFIRFGGPDFKPDQIRLAEFITMHVAQLLEHDQLVQRIASLEAERKLDRLQEDFIATVSHELLTPLGFIKGYATTLAREDTEWDDATRREFLAIIDEEADRLRELIDTLMDSSRLQAGTLRMKFQPVRLEAFLRDIAQRAKSRNADQEIQVQIDSPGMVIPADPARLAQVFDNLLSNAAKYAPGAAITVRLAQKDAYACIHVQDNGPGIAPEHLSHLFKRFYRVPTNNTTVRGTGLGLFICRQIVRAHDGKINAESTPGEGTAFKIYLPLERNQSEEQHITLRES